MVITIELNFPTKPYAVYTGKCLHVCEFILCKLNKYLLTSDNFVFPYFRGPVFSISHRSTSLLSQVSMLKMRYTNFIKSDLYIE